MQRQLKFYHVVMVVCLGALFISTRSSSAEKDGLLKIYFLSVGQGDSEFIETPNGTQILIDGGPDGTVLSELGKIMPFFDHDIDLVMVSHPHSDHVAGLIQVLDRYDVAHIAQADEVYDSPQFRSWQNAVVSEHANNVEALSGKVFDFGDGVTLTIIYPFNSYEGVTLTKPHEANVTAILKYKDFKVLLAGDMEKKAEDALINRGIDLSSQILKVGHHGSKTSTSEEFLDAVNPEVAFIEVGKNNTYHLPYPATLIRLEASNVPYYRTDEKGTMKVTTNGKEFRIVLAN